MDCLLIQTPLGTLFAQATKEALLSLRFLDCIKSHKVTGIYLQSKDPLLEGDSNKGEWIANQKVDGPLFSLQRELILYFRGSLKKFKTPLFYSGTPFQQKVWNNLQQIPFGTTCSYFDLAQKIGCPSASRAVGGAVRANPLMIVIPCHRVIYSTGDLGAYVAGKERKKRLLEMEKVIS